MKPKKHRFTLQKYENRPFRAKKQIFGNSVFSQSTIRPIPSGGSGGSGTSLNSDSGVGNGSNNGSGGSGSGGGVVGGGGADRVNRRKFSSETLDFGPKSTHGRKISR